jgi:glyoxalase family protein
MGFRKAGEEGRRTRFETGRGGPHAILDVVESGPGAEGEESMGTVHHVAWRTADAAHQSEWRDTMVKAGRNVTPVIDRYYFKSIYFREPGGVLFEIATDGPGFTVDETAESLGSTLSLPPWFNVRRDRLDVTLPPIVVPTTATTGAEH